MDSSFNFNVDPSEFVNVTVKTEPDDDEYLNSGESFTYENQLLTCKMIENIKKESEENQIESSSTADFKLRNDSESESPTEEISSPRHVHVSKDQILLRYEIEYVENEPEGSKSLENTSESFCDSRIAAFPDFQEVKIEQSSNDDDETIESEDKHAANSVKSEITELIFHSNVFAAKSNLTKPNQVPSVVHQCEVCGKAFIRKSHLTRHERIHSRVDFKCELCQKTFIRQSNLTTHEKVHHSFKPYKCEVCSKSFSQKSNFTKHQRIHTGIKPYKCEVCPKAFIRKSILVAHERIHTGIKPFECDVCWKAFTQTSDLTKHKRIHSGIKPYKCEVCSKTFTQKTNLNKHERIHSGVKPYKCEVCLKAFIQKSRLTVHERIHSGIKPYKCEVCEKEFSEKSHKKRHLKVHYTQHYTG